MVYWWLWQILYRTCMCNLKIFCPDSRQTRCTRMDTSVFLFYIDRKKSIFPSHSHTLLCLTNVNSITKRWNMILSFSSSSSSIDEQSLDRENYLSMNRIIFFSETFICAISIQTPLNLWPFEVVQKKSHQADGLIFFSGICHFWNCTVLYDINQNAISVIMKDARHRMSCNRLIYVFHRIYYILVDELFYLATDTFKRKNG